jgi:hypothetical protein
MATEPLSTSMPLVSGAEPGGDDALAAGLISSDPAILLLALQTASRHSQSEAARQDVEEQSRLVEQLREQMKQAMKRAEEAQNDAGFWGDLSNVLGGDVASICGVIATAAAVVGTGGAAAPAIVALVAAGMSITADVGGRLGLDPKVCLALSGAGALVGVVGGNFRSATGIWNTIARVGNVSQGVATAGGSGATIVAGQYQGDALDARADAKHAEGQQGDAWLRMQMALDILQDAARDLERSQRTVSSIESDKSAGHSAIIAHMGGAS